MTKRLPSPAIVVATVALVAALSGTAIAGPQAITSALSPAKTKKIAKKQARKEIAKRAPAIADRQIDKRAPGLAVASAATAATATTAGDAAALGGQPAGAYATDAEVGQRVAGLGRVVSGSVTLPASNAEDERTVLAVPGFVDFQLDCDAGQMFWEFENTSGGELHVSAIGIREAVGDADTLYRTTDVGAGNAFAFFGGNYGGYHATVQLSTADGKVATITGFVDPHGGTECRASAQATLAS